MHTRVYLTDQNSLSESGRKTIDENLPVPMRRTDPLSKKRFFELEGNPLSPNMFAPLPAITTSSDLVDHVEFFGIFDSAHQITNGLYRDTNGAVMASVITTTIGQEVEVWASDYREMRYWLVSILTGERGPETVFPTRGSG